MPGEIRYLIFSGAELCEAIDKYGRRTSSSFPTGNVIKANIVGDDIVSVTAIVQNGSSSVSHSIGPEDLLKVMIRFCHEMHVPLPARGSKQMRRVNGMLACEVTLENKHRRSSQPTVPPRKKRSIPDQIRHVRSAASAA